MTPEIARASLSDWASFYVITGSAAAALTGLQFVVMALVTEMRGRGSLSTIDAFGTPTIVHFCAVLLVSAAVSAPWNPISDVAYLLAACGIAGVVYAVLVARRAKRQTGYQPVLEDWVWHAALPFIAYLVLLIGALILAHHETLAMFTTGGAALLLLFIGIHNAWDSVTYIVAEQIPEKKD
jgi:hypothetical protein